MTELHGKVSVINETGEETITCYMKLVPLNKASIEFMSLPCKNQTDERVNKIIIISVHYILLIIDVHFERQIIKHLPDN